MINYVIRIMLNLYLFHEYLIAYKHTYIFMEKPACSLLEIHLLSFLTRLPLHSFNSAVNNQAGTAFGFTVEVL